MTTQITTKRANQILVIGLISSLLRCGSSASACTGTDSRQSMKLIIKYPAFLILGGTSSAGNSINDQSWVAGYSRLTGNQTRHAVSVAKRFAARPPHTRRTQ